MNEKIKNAWNEWSDGYYGENARDDRLSRLKADPRWAFPSEVRGMLKTAYADFRGLKVLVPSSGDNFAAFAFHMLGAAVTSADLSERQLYNAKRIADARGWDIDFVCDDTMTLSRFGDGEFDLVYTSNGVHVWICDLPEMYRNVCRVLKPGGRVIMFETHPFIRPFGDDGVPVLSVRKPYAQTGQSGEIPNFGWRVMDIFNALSGSGLVITHMEEFHPQKDDCDLWFYKNREDAESDGYKKFDWRQNPWAVMPQWLGFSALKQS